MYKLFGQNVEPDARGFWVTLVIFLLKRCLVEPATYALRQYNL